METTENNKLIAEFIGLEKENGLYLFTTPMDDYKTDTLYFDTSWDWLIPVVEKIKYCMNYNMSIRDVEEALLTTKISVVYLTVVEFIKWYNKNKED